MSRSNTLSTVSILVTAGLVLIAVFPLARASAQAALSKAINPKGSVSKDNAYQVLTTAAPFKGDRKTNPTDLTGRVVTGYQGWFRAEGDGSGLKFSHYDKRGRFEPGACSIDLWPDLTEFDSDEKYPTEFRHKDGKVAHVFSSVNAKTVQRHFSWMSQYEIDGAFVQRFGVHGAKPHNNFRRLKFDNQKLMLCRDAAIQNDRCYALMYDLSGLADEDFERLAEDWKQLRRRMQLGTDDNDTAYLRVNGKPLVAIWGVGFADDRKYSLKKAEWFVRLLKHNPEWGGMSIMLGVPYRWREQRGDATKDPDLHSVLQLADVISPWSVGRYRTSQEVTRDVAQHQRLDSEWCDERKIEYLPVLFPGFSWKNLNGEQANGISRDGGRFLWRQFNATFAAGNQSAYIAMFDEIDEGTAIFKCTNDPPIGKSKFLTYESLPSDHYLWLCREGRRLLRGDLPSR
jgi:hypothetical protein